MEKTNIEIRSGDEKENDSNVDEIIEERKEKIINFLKGKDKGTQENKEEAIKPEREHSNENKIIEDKSGEIRDEKVIRIRKDKIKSLLKGNYNWITYILLAIIVWISVKIRTRNLPRLTDITTGTWTLGPDLDPFLFLRMAKYIVEHGTLFAIDMMRYVPLGFDVQEDYVLHPYLIAWFHKVAILFGSESVTYSAVVFPVFMFALTVIAFFFLARIIFIDSLGQKKANIIALISSFFLTVFPILLPRTIAGIPEKESAAFLFLFLAFYFFLAAWKSKKNIPRYSFAMLAGFATAAMAMIWGGYIFIFIILAPSVFIAFLLGKIDKDKIYVYSLWLASAFIPMSYFSTRYSIINFFSSVYTSIAIGVLLIMLVHFLIFNTKLKNYIGPEKLKLSKIPRPIFSVVITVIILAIGGTLFFGASFIPSHVNNIVDNLIKPATSRLIQTVAENRQPYFTEWANNFGPYVKSIPITFWLFFVGSIYLFNYMVRPFRKKERLILVSSYIIFLFAIVFSRYSSNSNLNGENTLSLAVYGLGFIILLGSLGFYYYKYYKNKEQDKLKNIDFGLIFLFIFFFLSIIGSRGAVRLIMMLVPPASIMISYLVVSLFFDVKKLNSGMRIFGWIIVVIVVIATIFAGYSLYNSVNDQAEVFAPSVYTQQWQKAMAWVRENTPENSVFGHWWDYGYWVQSLGERATVLDGGNAISYWNHLMGRHALTGTDNRDAIEFLYTHDTTHFLIDSTDIGKYGAFSFIGSDVNLDRRSGIPTFMKDASRTQETKDTTIFLYVGGAGLDEDIIYEENGTQVFLPRGGAGLGGILVTKDREGNIPSQPIGIFIYQNQQHTIPMRYAFSNGKFLDFGSGIESGIFLFPSGQQQGGNIGIDPDGALFYMSQRTVKSQLARLYLYKEDNNYFKLVHSEDDLLVSQLKAQYPEFDDDFLFFQGFRGPIRIWEINYPSDISLKEEYLNIDYPPELRIA